MIFQISAELEIAGREVYVVFDLDTGMFGFTEITREGHKEYTYQSSPHEFKIALAMFMESIAGKKHQSNTLICRKGKAARVLTAFWQGENGPQS